VNFIHKLDKATPASISGYCFSHSMLCTEMLLQYEEKKKEYTRRSLDNITKYNNNFYELVSDEVLKHLDSFTIP